MSELLLKFERLYVPRVKQLDLVEPASNVPCELGLIPRGRCLLEGPSHGHILAHSEPTWNKEVSSSQIRETRPSFERTHVSTLVVTAVTLVGPALGDGGELLIPNLKLKI